MRILPRRVLGQSVALEQLRAPTTTLGARLVCAREALHLTAHLHERVEVVHALRHQRDAVAAQRGKRRRILLRAVEPDAAAHRGVRLEQPQHGIGQKRLAGTRRAYHGHDLARMYGDA